MKSKVKSHSTMDTAEKVKLIVTRLEDKKALDVVALNLHGLTPMAEAMVIASAHNVRHAQGASNGVTDMAGEQNLEVLGLEGVRNGQWILLDLNDVLVHIFQKDVREAVNLEGLWSEAGVMFRSVEDYPDEDAEDDDLEDED
jgi:ribosome-associated protein